jgi:TolA-binding protein
VLRFPEEGALAVALVRLLERVGETARARAVAERTLAGTASEATRGLLQGQLASFDLDEATRLVAAGRGEEADELLGRRLASVDDPELATRIAEHRRKLASVASSNRALARYNEAVVLVRERRFEQARAALRAVVESFPDAPIVPQAKQARADLEAYLEKRSAARPDSSPPGS